MGIYLLDFLRSKVGEGGGMEGGRRRGNGVRTEHVVVFAFLSRLVMIGLIISADLFISDYDTSCDVTRVDVAMAEGQEELDSSFIDDNNALHYLSDASATTLDLIIRKCLTGFSRWDGVYFTDISTRGYEFEHQHAFFPLLPAGIRLLVRSVLSPLLQSTGLVADEFSLVLLAGVIICNVCFVLAAGILFNLTHAVFQTSKPSDRETIACFTAILFCLTPANVFMSVIYSEPVYAFFSFLGLYLLSVARRPWTASVVFAIAGYSRSNAILHAIFVLHDTAMQCWPLDVFKSSSRKGTNSLTNLVWVWFPACLRCVVMFLPLWSYQIYAYYVYCIPTEKAEWCSKFPPDVYGHVQKSYWNVGPFKYYEVKQIPNFALALPIVLVSTMAVAIYFGRIFGVRSRTTSNGPPHDATSTSSRRKRRESARINSRSPSRSDNENEIAPVPTPTLDVMLWSYEETPAALPYVLHLFVLLGIGVVVVHIQVVTRFLSACPAIYWLVACIFVDLKHSRQQRVNDGGWKYWFSRVWLVYATAYSIIGVVLFSNFLPWT